MQLFITILRFAGAALAVCLLIVFIMPMTVQIINIGNIAGIIFSLWLFCVSLPPLQQAISGVMHRCGFTTLLYRAVNIGFVAFACYGLIVTAAMVIACQARPAPGATAVVLGAHVRPDGSPSQILLRRIEAAQEYLTEDPGTKAVLSGGKGSDEVISEAQCMYRVMTDGGIDPDRLLPEERSTDTDENFRYSLEIIEQNHLGSDIAIVTDGFHMLRAVITARKQGAAGEIGTVCADTRWEFLPTYAVREWIAMPKLLIT